MIILDHLKVGDKASTYNFYLSNGRAEAGASHWNSLFAPMSHCHTGNLKVINLGHTWIALVTNQVRYKRSFLNELRSG